MKTLLSLLLLSALNFTLSTSPMTGGIGSYELLQVLETAITPWANENKGVVNVAHDPAEALELLGGQAPENWRLIIGVEDEDSAEAYPALAGASYTQFFTMIQTGIGLSVTPGDEIHRKRAGDSPSILEIAEAVRSYMRGLRFNHPAVDCQVGFSWVGTKWVTLKEEGKPARFARQHHFTQLHLVQPPADLAPITIPT